MTGNYSIPICFLVSNTEKLASEMEKHILTCCYVHEIHLGAFLDRQSPDPQPYNSDSGSVLWNKRVCFLLRHSGNQTCFGGTP